MAVNAPSSPERRFWTIAIGTVLIFVLSIAAAAVGAGYGLMIQYVHHVEQQQVALQAEQRAQQIRQAKPLCTAIKNINVILAKTPANDQAAHQIATDWNVFYVATKCPQILNGTYRG